MNRYTNIVEKANYWLFLVAAFLLPFPQICLRYACVVWFIAWVLEGRWLHRPRSLRENKMAIPLLLFGLWYVWQLVSGLWAGNHATWASQMERYITFGVMIPVGIWGVNAQYQWRQAARALIIGCISVAILYPIIFSILLHHKELISAVHWKAIWDYSSLDWFYFYQSNLSNIKHRLFLNSVEMMAIILAVQICPKRPKNILLLIGFIALMVTSMVLSGARQAIPMMLAVGVASLLIQLPQRARWKYGIGLLLIAGIIGGAALTFHPRMQKLSLQDITHIRSLNTEQDVRLVTWGTALQTPSDYFWGGLGAGQNSVYLEKQFDQLGLSDYIQLSGHCHNQYLQECIELGIFGLILFVIAWISIAYCAHGKGRETAILFTVLYMVNMCTDCMFAKYCGIALWAVSIVFIMLQSEKKEEELLVK